MKNAVIAANVKIVEERKQEAPSSELIVLNETLMNESSNEAPVPISNMMYDTRTLPVPHNEEDIDVIGFDNELFQCVDTMKDYT